MYADDAIVDTTVRQTLTASQQRHAAAPTNRSRYNAAPSPQVDVHAPKMHTPTEKDKADTLEEFRALFHAQPAFVDLGRGEYRSITGKAISATLLGNAGRDSTDFPIHRKGTLTVIAYGHFPGTPPDEYSPLECGNAVLTKGLGGSHFQVIPVIDITLCDPGTPAPQDRILRQINLLTAAAQGHAQSAAKAASPTPLRRSRSPKQPPVFHGPAGGAVSTKEALARLASARKASGRSIRGRPVEDGRAVASTASPRSAQKRKTHGISTPASQQMCALVRPCSCGCLLVQRFWCG